MTVSAVAVAITVTEDDEFMKKTSRLIIIAFATALSLLLPSCGNSVLYDSSMSVNEHGWLPTDSLRFDVDVDDTTHLFDFLIEVRNNVNYPYSNLFLFVNTTFPDGSVARDTMECPLANEEGRWYGKRAGRYVDSRYRLRTSSMRFPMSGQYSFAVSNGMRDSAIDGIKDIALRIEYTKTK